ncbi:MAG: hypothetical protein JNN11_01100 [Candidatus Doudnabacteria bacterium]|nr:hypothetical protein [Candidatus Doudnabacteria bacterium]
MEILFYILLAFGAYLFFAFVLLRLVAPFMGFRLNWPVVQVPIEIKQAVKSLEDGSDGQASFLRNLYLFVLEKNKTQWSHSRGRAAIMLPRLFVKDLNEIWKTKKFVYCNAINYVAYVMLVQSKYFKPDDIKVRHVFLNFVPHQYLQVKLEGKWLDFDPAGSGIRGGSLGTHASFFG